ncbi:hypothetical protein PACTADRAFT_34831 [Pachysolen tannophilus NRRL Y-2460]|uniref:DNA mismatch repair protein S5 domain-containing protein n=1 Tax=Pachysolen tannophilus NRRL Y-2460 TaxID=669874 RepID=A0A1E4TTP2_PACTA|nr:hypothetical protein PACTADRAFT_34831 [Pachysolen tannophilus NRRL Y-2460]
MSNEEVLQPARIRPLDVSVVNRIAAGEIIIGPSNALKEILENSIDAKSTSIEVLVKEGGLKQLQITDNGNGIEKDDLPILCERFTTSKLEKFEDLDSIATYGFRGEALASISHISHLTVTTKTNKSPCAWKCFYSDGKLIPMKPKTSSEPKAVAGKNGTQILVEDLFYNVPSRLRALRSASEEFHKILEVVGKYAIHTGHVGFSCKKFGESYNSLTTRSDLPIKERIRAVYGSAIANELVEIQVLPNEDIGLVQCFAQITNPNYGQKKTTEVFFINNRLVSCDPLKRALNQLYSVFLPKGNKPFLYLALEINAKNVDVNVHPTKREVRFLFEDEIIEYIVSIVQEKLTSLDSSRTFLTQQVLPRAKRFREEEDYESNSETAVSNTPSSNSWTQKVKRQENRLVRTDSSQVKITTFINGKNNRSGEIINAESDENDEAQETIQNEIGGTGGSGSSGSTGNTGSTGPSIEYKSVNRERIKVKLGSVLSLRDEVESNIHKDLTQIFSKHTYVGVVDAQRRLAAIQYDVKLYLVDYAAVLNELFYQIGLSDFSNFGKIYLNSDGLSIKNLLQGLEIGKEISIDKLIDTMTQMKEMLEEYFAIEIDDEDKEDPKIKTVPLLIKGYLPPLSKLPLFLYRIGTQVHWTEEKLCFEGILKQIALFYIPEILPIDKNSETSTFKEFHYTMENVLFPALKRRLLATNTLANDVVEIANLPGLYKVFERC